MSKEKKLDNIQHANIAPKPEFSAGSRVRVKMQKKGQYESIDGKTGVIVSVETWGKTWGEPTLDTYCRVRIDGTTAVYPLSPGDLEIAGVDDILGEHLISWTAQSPENQPDFRLDSPEYIEAIRQVAEGHVINWPDEQIRDFINLLVDEERKRKEVIVASQAEALAEQFSKLPNSWQNYFLDKIGANWNA